MSIASAISALQSASSDIASAIAAKGVTVPSGSGFNDYASLIGQISGGGGGGGPHSLPSGYTKLSYIENPLNNNAYIDTEVQINHSPGFSITFMSYDDNNSSSYGCIIGARYASNTHDYQFSSYTGISGFSGTLRLGSSKQNNAHLPSKNTQFIASLNNTTYEINSTSYTVTRDASTTYTLKWFLFALNNNGTASQNGHGRVYALKLYASGYLVRDFVPCKNQSNVVGLYDLISERFFGSANSSTFTAGPNA